MPTRPQWIVSRKRATFELTSPRLVDRRLSSLRTAPGRPPRSVAPLPVNPWHELQLSANSAPPKCAFSINCRACASLWREGSQMKYSRVASAPTKSRPTMTLTCLLVFTCVSYACLFLARGLVAGSVRHRAGGVLQTSASFKSAARLHDETAVPLHFDWKDIQRSGSRPGDNDSTLLRVG